MPNRTLISNSLNVFLIRSGPEDSAELNFHVQTDKYEQKNYFYADYEFSWKNNLDIILYQQNSNYVYSTNNFFLFFNDVVILLFAMSELRGLRTKTSLCVKDKDWARIIYFGIKTGLDIGIDLQMNVLNANPKECCM